MTNLERRIERLESITPAAAPSDLDFTGTGRRDLSFVKDTVRRLQAGERYADFSVVELRRLRDLCARAVPVQV